MMARLHSKTYKLIALYGGAFIVGLAITVLVLTLVHRSDTAEDATPKATEQAQTQEAAPGKETVEMVDRGDGTQVPFVRAQAP